MKSTHQIQAERLMQPAQEITTDEDTTHTTQMKPLTREYVLNDAPATRREGSK